MTRASRGKLVSFLAGAGVLAVAVLAWFHRENIAAWYEFVSIFESLGKNDQGYSEYRHRQTGIVMVWIPGGTFLQGSPESEEGSWANEHPRREVTLDPFLIAKYEVSQAVWEKVMGSNPSDFRGDNLPVEKVSWNDCREFCKKTGFSLPTEAQWERACRGGTDTPFAFGEAITSDQVNYNGNFPYGAASKGSYRRRTVPVDSLEPNGFGLYNTHGNVWEWCEDVYDEDFYGKPESRRENPICKSGTGNRGIRGGGWFNRARYCRSAGRSWHDPSQRSNSVGFRPAWSTGMGGGGSRPN